MNYKIFLDVFICAGESVWFLAHLKIYKSFHMDLLDHVEVHLYFIFNGIAFTAFSSYLILFLDV